MRSAPLRTFTLVVAALASTSAALADESDIAPARAAVRRAVPWLAADMVAWREANDCSACHHGPLYIWSTNLAKRQGYDVDDEQLQTYTRWLLDDPASRVFPETSVVAATGAAPSAADRMTTAMMGHQNLSQPTLYLAHALNALPPNDPAALAGWRKLAEHWRSAQRDDGSFAGRAGRPPIFNTPQVLTRFAATALADRPPATTNDATLNAALVQIEKQSAEFLTSQTPDATHQGLVLRLLAASLTADAGRPALLGELLSLQRPDGGWSQSADRPSDAFATGQTLYVLHRAGVARSEPAVCRALAYLAESQNADGTWTMTSRPDPETGKPAEYLNPITYAAAAWATIGLTAYVPNE